MSNQMEVVDRDEKDLPNHSTSHDPKKMYKNYLLIYLILWFKSDIS